MPIMILHDPLALLCAAQFDSLSQPRLNHPHQTLARHGASTERYEKGRRRRYLCCHRDLQLARPVLQVTERECLMVCCPPRESRECHVRPAAMEDVEKVVLMPSQEVVRMIWLPWKVRSVMPELRYHPSVWRFLRLFREAGTKDDEPVRLVERCSMAPPLRAKYSNTARSRCFREPRPTQLAAASCMKSLMSWYVIMVNLPQTPTDG